MGTVEVTQRDEDAEKYAEQIVIRRSEWADDYEVYIPQHAVESVAQELAEHCNKSLVDEDVEQAAQQLAEVYK
jgi:hypothetical protein